jgi:hypothetical protein
MIGKGGPWPFFNYTPALALQLRNCTENFSQVSREVGDYSLRRHGWRSMDSLGWPTSITRRWFQSALGRHRCLQICRTKGFPASANFETKLSVSALMWSAKNGIHRSSWICLLPTYKGALLAMRRHLDCNKCSFRTWVRAADLQIGHA